MHRGCKKQVRQVFCCCGFHMALKSQTCMGCRELIQLPAAEVWALGNRTWLKIEGRRQRGTRVTGGRSTKDKLGLGEILIEAKGNSRIS